MAARRRASTEVTRWREAFVDLERGGNIAHCANSFTLTPTFFSVPFPNTGSYPDSINNAGHITGYYYDVSGAVHGFVG
jgi:hypothetical protein